MAIFPNVYDVLEQTTPLYTATVTDNTGAALPASALTTLALTLYVINADGTTTIVNGRSHQTVLNANNVTVDANGLVSWTVQPADLAVINPILPFERHIALFEWSWANGTKTGRHEVVLNVQNMTLVP